MGQPLTLVKKVRKAKLQKYRQSIFQEYVVKQLLIYLKDKHDEFHSKENEMSKYIYSKVIYSTKLLLHARRNDGLYTPSTSKL
jgi:hypothetical protein